MINPSTDPATVIDRARQFLDNCRVALGWTAAGQSDAHADERGAETAQPNTLLPYRDLLERTRAVVAAHAQTAAAASGHDAPNPEETLNRAGLPDASPEVPRRQMSTASGRVVTVQGNPTNIKAAHSLYASARRVFWSHASDLLDKARVSLKPFRSLPLPFSPFDVMDANTLERAYQSTLSWLLDPSGRHGFGDRFLRRFLALVGINEFHEIVGLSTTLRPALASEVQWSTNTHNSHPGEGLWSKGGKARVPRIRCDLVVALPPRLYAIELKVKSSERLYELDGARIPQAALYERSLALLCARKRGELGRVYSSRADFDDAQARLIREALYAYPPTFRASVEACTMIQGVLVHLDSDCSHGEEPEVPPQHRHWRKPIRHLDWRDIAVMLSDLRHQRAVDGASVAVLDGLRQAIYRSVQANEFQDLLTSAETLRILCDQPQLIRRWPQETQRLIGVIMQALAKRPECTKEPAFSQDPIGTRSRP